MKKEYFKNTKEFLADLEEQKKKRSDAYAGSTIFIVIFTIIDIIQLPFIAWNNWRVKI